MTKGDILRAMAPRATSSFITPCSPRRTRKRLGR